MENKPDYQKALGTLADELEEMRSAIGVIEVAHRRALNIPDI